MLILVQKLCYAILLKKGIILLTDSKKKKIYDIPIIIESSLDGDKYKFKVVHNVKQLKTNKIYQANYKLIKFCSNDVWDKITNNIHKK